MPDLVEEEFGLPALDEKMAGSCPIWTKTMIGNAYDEHPLALARGHSAKATKIFRDAKIHSGRWQMPDPPRCCVFSMADPSGVAEDRNVAYTPI